MKDFLTMIEEAEKGMRNGAIYDTTNMQIIWHQMHTHNDWIDHLLISMDKGKTFKNIVEHGLSVDYGKWYYDDPDCPWYFKWV